jgi:hypothetical protein
VIPVRPLRTRLSAALLVVLGIGVIGCLGPIERPTADFAWCPDGAQGELDYVFSSTSKTVGGQELARAVWEFGDGTPERVGMGPLTHRFPASGSYAVTLTVTDRRGVSGTATQTVAAELAAFIDPTWQLTLGYPPTVSGVVGNRSTGRLSEVVVRVRFYDADGIRLGEGRCAVPDVEPRERARFDVMSRESAARVFYATVDVESFSADCVPPGIAAK